jgi:hypothetical protein|tara:strand:- start:298 stop:516 length:219 start_codon:yes stop_codon:yes gene_type:complete
MKLFKAISNSIKNLLGVVDNALLGANNLSLIWVDVTDAARKEQALESLNDFKQLATECGMSEADLKKMQAAL